MKEATKSFKKYNREKLLKDEEARVKKLEEELGIRPCEDAIAKRLGRSDKEAAAKQ